MIHSTVEMRKAAQMCLHYADELFKCMDSPVEIASAGISLCERICCRASHALLAASPKVHDETPATTESGPPAEPVV